MNDEIQARCSELRAPIIESSECESSAPSCATRLLVPDPYNFGRFRSVCPDCKHQRSPTAFPLGEFRNLFEMLIDSAEADKPVMCSCSPAAFSRRSLTACCTDSWNAAIPTQTFVRRMNRNKYEQK